MKIEVSIAEGPAVLSPSPEPGCGAVARFDGVVRGEESGRPIAGLRYEAYRPMAEEVMRRILAEIAREHPFALARVCHRIGFVPVGEAAIRVEIQSAHRAEAFAAMAGFMDRLKRDVPIWKVEAVPADAPPGERRADPGDLSIERVWEEIDARTAPLSAEEIPVSEARGRIVAEPVLARFDQPPFDASAVDGYAVGPEGKGGLYVVVGRRFAGEAPGGAVHAGEVFRVLTGAPVPEGAAAVMKQEECALEGDAIRLPRVPAAGENIRRRGGAFREGSPVLGAGVRIGPGAVALLASAGVDSVRVARRPSVLHLVTGDELVASGQTPGPGQIPDSNGPMIAAFLAEAGASAMTRRVRDDVGKLAGEVGRFWGDLLLISGGAGPGDRDHAAKVLEGAGFALHVARVNSRPGRPMIFATRGRQVAFALPGNPLSHFVCYHAFVRRSLARMAGAEPPGFLRGRMVGGGVGPSDDGRRTWSPASVCAGGDGPALRSLRWEHSGDLMPLASATALALGPADARGMVSYLPL
jgi:molybdopterin molybdotransferase